MRALEKLFERAFLLRGRAVSQSFTLARARFTDSVMRWPEQKPKKETHHMAKAKKKAVKKTTAKKKKK